jgi:predicted hydrocarbon binding protein
MAGGLTQERADLSLYAILGLTGLHHIGWDHFPPDNADRQIDFVDIGAFNKGLIYMYGPKGAHGLQVKTGEWMYSSFRPELHAVVSSSPHDNLAAKVFQLAAALSDLFLTQSDQLTQVEQEQTTILFAIRRCPHCWGLKENEVFCYPVVGFLTGLVRDISDTLPFTVAETECQAKGDTTCQFRIHLVGEAWRACVTTQA